MTATKTESRWQIEGQDESGQWTTQAIAFNGPDSYTIFDSESEARDMAAELAKTFAANDPDFDPETIRVIERATVSLEAIRDQVKATVLKSYVRQGWFAVRVHTDGEIVESFEASPCYSRDEYFRERPHTVTVWASGTGTGCMNQEEADEESDNGDWGDWFECNLPTLAKDLEPTGLIVVD